MNLTHQWIAHSPLNHIRRTGVREANSQEATDIYHKPFRTWNIIIVNI